MGYRDLREWLNEVDELDELRRIDGADWNLEMGTIVELIYKKELESSPAVLFDQIKGYPPGHRVLFGQLGTYQRMALTLGMASQLGGMMDFIKAYRRRMQEVKPIPPRFVDSGPVMENVATGSDVDIYQFPAPFHHELDGGRYFGTGHIVITRDPEEGWVNFGTYRLMVHDRNTLGFYISPGKHGAIHRQKYFERGEPCPVAVALGSDPLLWFASTSEIPGGLSEYDFAGGLKGEPIEVIKGPLTGLPIPATAEIALEGESYPNQVRDEGPFGEWPGYYAGRGRPEPILRVKSIMYRSNPIMTSSQTTRPPNDNTFQRVIARSALVWDEMEKAGVPDIRGVWCHPAGGSRQLIIVSIKQRFAGHARQAATIASQCRAGAYMCRFVLVVDEDIDPSNTYDVLWAMASRTDPQQDIDILRKSWSSKADPLIRKGSTSFFNSRAIIDACRPYDWIDEFPPVSESTPELRQRILEKFGEYI